nr:PEP-CTERM sorting domain-containing protein [Bryobacter sp.]
FGSSTPLALEGITGPGDSGSGLWVDFGSGPVITGVLFGGYNPFGDNNEYGDLSIFNWLGSSANRSWLESNGVTDGSVPEPGTVFAGVGLLAFALYRRRSAGR